MLKISRMIKSAIYGGGWFLPHGKTLRLSTDQSHASLANHYLYPERDSLNPIRDGRYDDLFSRNGWIRFWFDEQGLCIETTIENWTTRNFQQIQEYVMANPETLGGKPDVYIEVGRTFHIDRDIFLTANKPNDLYRVKALGKVSHMIKVSKILSHTA
jgi:hypothetical protein